MKVSEIKSRIYNYYNNSYNNLSVQNNVYNLKLHPLLEKDVFQKTNDASISFVGNVTECSEDLFRKKYTDKFFRKLLAEGVPCAYTGLPMIPTEELSKLNSSQVFNKKASVAIEPLKKYEDCLVDGGIEKKALKLLEKESKKHPDMKLQELLRLKYPLAEKALVAQQAKVMDSIIMMARDNLPPEDYKKVRQFCQVYFDKILAQDPLPEDRFRRKDLMFSLFDLDISNEKIKQAMQKKASKLPTSTTSFNSFIVKYSQPYKFKYTEDGRIVKSVRDSQDLANRILCRFRATDEHIYPQDFYKKEEKARQNGEEWAKYLSNYRVTILTNDYINSQKGNMPIDDFINISPYPIPKNIQHHVDRLIEIDKKWLIEGKVEDAILLADYIIDLKKEFDRRSHIVNLSISGLSTDTLPSIWEVKSLKKTGKRLPSAGRADNSHHEAYVDRNGHVMKNRKTQEHSARRNKK